MSTPITSAHMTVVDCGLKGTVAPTEHSVTLNLVSLTDDAAFYWSASRHQRGLIADVGRLLMRLGQELCEATGELEMDADRVADRIADTALTCAQRREMAGMASVGSSHSPHGWGRAADLAPAEEEAEEEQMIDCPTCTGPLVAFRPYCGHCNGTGKVSAKEAVSR